MSIEIIEPNRRFFQPFYLASFDHLYIISVAVHITIFESARLILQMGIFERLLYRIHKVPRSSAPRPFSTSPVMSSSGTAAALYAATVSSSSIMGAVPEEAKEKRHHLKDGKGFVNPWESWKAMPGPAIGRAMVM